MRFLIVDENESLTYLLSEYLKTKGHECIYSHNYNNGITLLREKKFDGVLMDISICAGEQIVDELQRLELEKNKIVVLTKNNLSNNEIKILLDKGVMEILKKPARPDVILSTLLSVGKTKRSGSIALRH